MLPSVTSASVNPATKGATKAATSFSPELRYRRFRERVHRLPLTRVSDSRSVSQAQRMTPPTNAPVPIPNPSCRPIRPLLSHPIERDAFGCPGVRWGLKKITIKYSLPCFVCSPMLQRSSYMAVCLCHVSLSPMSSVVVRCFALVSRWGWVSGGEGEVMVRGGGDG